MSEFKAVKISDRVYWVGVVDWALRNFHGYTTHRGSTYNAYIILDEKITLVDTVKAPFKEQFIARISDVVDPKKISYIISNHAEMDHSGLLPYFVEYVKPEKIFASPMGVKALKEQFHWDENVVAVKDGERISLGNTHITFYETRMLHWPDSMFSYLEEEKILFSQDAFGMHLATGTLFADEVDKCVLEYEAATYYANILLPYSNLVLNLIKKLKNLGISPSIIATDHGPIYRKPEDIEWILSSYESWAEQKPQKRAVIIYDTMWGSTAKMAHAIADGIAREGVEVNVLHIEGAHRSDVATEVLLSGALIVGSPTINNNIFPSVADVLTYLKGLRPKNLIGAVFGSYGWSGESIKHLREWLESMGVEVIGEVGSKYVPDTEILNRCRDLGKEVALKLKELCKT